MNYRALTRDKSPQTARILKRVTGHRISGQALYSSSVSLFGGWNSSLKSAGIDPARVRRDRKFWTKPVVIEAIRALHSKGISLNPTRIQHDPPALSAAVLFRAIGRRTNANGVYLAAFRRFPSWKIALQEAEVPHWAVWDRNRTWNRTLVVQCLRELSARGFILNVALVRRDPSGEIRIVIENALECRSSGARLVTAARKHFGSWAQALRAARIPVPPPPRTAKRFWSKELIIKCIHDMIAAGYGGYIGTPFRASPPELCALLKGLTGYPTDAISLTTGAKKIFGSWAEAIRQAGYCRDEHRVNRVVNERILRSIQELHKNGEPLNASAMQLQKSKTAGTLVLETTGHWEHTRGLYRVARHRFYSWDEALRQAGLAPFKIRAKPFRWSKPRIERGLMYLYVKGVSLHRNSISRDVSDSTRVYLIQSTGQDITGRRFFGLATRFYGTRDTALERASLNPCAIRKAGSPLERTVEKVAQAILTLKRENVPLNYSSLIKDSRPIRYVSHRNLLGVVSGLSILKAAVRKHGNWDKALLSARLNPEEIRLRSRYGWSLSIVPHQEERVKDATGDRLVRFMGEPPKSPHASLEQASLAAGIDAALKDLGEDDRTVAEQIFSLILSIDPSREEITDWPDLIEKHTQGSVPADEARRILGRLRQNRSLINQRE